MSMALIDASKAGSAGGPMIAKSVSSLGESVMFERRGVWGAARQSFVAKTASAR
jgi:hypothetical protein